MEQTIAGFRGHRRKRLGGLERIRPSTLSRKEACAGQLGVTVGVQSTISGSRDAALDAIQQLSALGETILNQADLRHAFQDGIIVLAG